MDYYSILNLCREPFSNSPDPEYFFKSRQHFSCLQKIELALRLRRGLNVIIGEVGTGKTTLCRQLLLRLSKDDQMETHLILDPSFDSRAEFLARVTQLISGKAPSGNDDQWRLKETIKHHLFRKGIEEEKIVSLIIDEGQKVPPFCIEILREFLNYETNEFKLLQIVLFAQQEFVQLLVEHSNFSDRVNFFTTLAPLNFQDTRLLIEYRLKKSSDTAVPPPLFSLPAYWAIYRISKGHPRKIIHLCHQSMLAMIIQNRRKIGYSLVQSCARRAIPPAQKHYKLPQKIAAIIAVGTIIFALGLFSHRFSNFFFKDSTPSIASGISRHPIPYVSERKNLGTSILSMEPGKDKRDTAPKALRPSKQSTHTMDLDDSSAKNKMPPFILGTLQINRGDNLAGLIKLVHGSFSSEYKEALLTLNPHLSNSNDISIGTVIQFPAMAVELASGEKRLYRLELNNFRKLAKARNALYLYRQKYADIQMVAYWNPEVGLRFSILLKEFFFDKASAEAKLNVIESIFGTMLESKPKIAMDWKKETLFFTNPYDEQD